MPLLSNLVHFGFARPVLPWAGQGAGGQEANKFPLRGFGRFGQFQLTVPTRRANTYMCIYMRVYTFNETLRKFAYRQECEQQLETRASKPGLLQIAAHTIVNS